MLLIERFRALRQHSHQFPPESFGGKLEAASLQEIGRALKYRFTDSGLAMLLALLRSQVKVSMPPAGQITPLWIEFQSPFTLDTYAQGVSLDPIQALYFTEYYSQRLRAIPSSPAIEKYIERMRDLYCLDVLMPDMVKTSAYYYHPQKQEFLFIKPHHPCPTGECRFDELTFLAQDNPGRYLHFPCLYCQTAKRICERILVLCLAMIRGDFAQTQEFVLPMQREYAVRRSGEGRKAHSYEIEHVYSIVSFDACLRPVSRVEEDEETRTGQHPGPTWLQRALSIDPDSIVYVSRAIGQIERTLRSPYFVHKQGQTIAVKPHDRLLPRKVGTITMTRASAFETSRGAAKKTKRKKGTGV